jgi:hypothetical protein
MGMESTSKITQWDPPRSFSKDGDGMGDDAPPVATEWIVEAKSGGTCVVRVVHSWFASTDEWDGQWEMVEKGWIAFLMILKLKLQHFLGQPCSAFDASGMSEESEEAAWTALKNPLGLSGASTGQKVSSRADSPLLEGKVEMINVEMNEMMVLTTQPGSGVCHLSAMSMGEQTYLSVRFYLFGSDAVAATTKAAPEWANWFAERFPMGG